MSGNEFPLGSNISFPFSVCFSTAPQAGGRAKENWACFIFDLTRFALQFCKATPPTSFGRIVVEGTVAHNRAIQYVICFYEVCMTVSKN